MDLLSSAIRMMKSPYYREFIADKITCIYLKLNSRINLRNVKKSLTLSDQAQLGRGDTLATAKQNSQRNGRS